MYGRQPGTPSSTFAAPGPSRPGTKVLWALVPVLSCSLLSFVPAVYLAARRRRTQDWAGVAFFAATTAAVCVGAVTGADPGRPYNAGDYVGITMMCIGMFLAPAHFLFMDRRRAWYGNAPAPQGYPMPPAPQPGYGYPQAAAPYPPTYFEPQPQPQPQPPFPPQPQAHPQAPFHPAPSPYPATPATDDAAARAELRELGDLLRRQAADGTPDGTTDGRRDGSR